MVGELQTYINLVSSINQLRKDSKDGNAYFTDAIIFLGESDKETFRGVIDGISSSQYVSFPFVPRTFYVDVKRDLIDTNKEYKNELDIYSIKDKEQLKEIWEYYVEPT